MEITTYDINEAPPGDSWILLYYGPSGTGKTWFCGTAGERSFFINIGDGLETLKSPLFRRFHKAPRIAIDINEKLDIKQDIDKVVAQGFDYTTTIMDYAFDKRLDEWDTMIIDDVTALRRMAINKALTLNPRPNTPERNRKEEYIKVDVGDYGIEMDMIQWMLGTYIPMFKANKKHLIMTAHERHIFGKPKAMGEAAPLEKVKPAFTGRTFPDQVLGYYDDVFRSESVGGMGNQVFRCYTTGNEMYAGKVRHNGIFADVEVNPNHAKMLQRITAGQLHPNFLRK